MAMTHKNTTAKYAFVNPAPAIIIHGKDNTKILEITFEGEVIWHAADQASEAAKVFCEGVSLGIEHNAGIKQSRKEWEDSIKKSILELYDSGELTRKALEKVFYKEEFVNKLSNGPE